MELNLALLHKVRGLSDRQRQIDGLFDQNDGGSLGSDGLDNWKELFDNDGGQSQTQFVNHQEFWSGQKGHRERQHLLLAPREISGWIMHSCDQGWEHLDHLAEALFPKHCIPSIEPPSDSEVFCDRQTRKDALTPWNLSDSLGRDLIGRCMGDVDSIKDHGTLVCFNNTADGSQERRLPGTICSEQGNDLPFANL